MVWVARFENYYKTLSYSLDNGENWTSITSSTAGTSFNVSAGDKVLLKGTQTSYGENSFSASTAYFNIEGNIMSLINGDNFSGATSLNSQNNYAFYNMFAYTNVVSAENLILPATTLAEGCYQGLFMGCTKLISIPELPATTLASSCYAYMFNGCTSLTSVSLILSATTLEIQSYAYMFEGCTSLTTAPELSATTLARYSCYNMFKGCTSLTTAPVLSATTLAERCYGTMFSGCTSLNYIKCLASDISASYCTFNWTKGVSATGTFVKAASMNDWTSGINGIPANWTVQNDDGSPVDGGDDPD